jgi:hypothetical protein
MIESSGSEGVRFDGAVLLLSADGASAESSL